MPLDDYAAFLDEYFGTTSEAVGTPSALKDFIKLGAAAQAAKRKL